MDASRTYTEVEAWRLAHQFNLSVYKATRSFPKEELYGLTSQFRRASLSIPANITEGYKKIGKSDKLRFFNIAQGSIEECRYYILLSYDLGYYDQETFESLDKELNHASRILNSYCRSIIANKGIVP